MQIPVVRNVLEANEKMAGVVRERVKGILTLNLISSPGAGKTTLLERTLTDLGKEFKMAVIEGDLQTDNDARFELDVAYLQSRSRFAEALAKADSLGTARLRHEKKHAIYAAQGAFAPAYDELRALLAEKDSIYIKVQNEDMAILDAEMNNAKLRRDAERLKAHNQNIILIGFIVMFAIAFMAILLSQWQLRQNLDEMKNKNNEMLVARRAYQKALDAKEAENSVKIKILQNRKSNTIRL